MYKEGIIRKGYSLLFLGKFQAAVTRSAFSAGENRFQFEEINLQ
jgi:hypothetical protein